MLITFPRVYFRYTTQSKVFNSTHWHKQFPGINKPILIGYIYDSTNISALKNGQSIIECAPYTKNNATRVKPQNALYVHRPHRTTDIRKLMCDLPWNLDLRTIDLDDYPEFFI